MNQLFSTDLWLFLNFYILGLTRNASAGGTDLPTTRCPHCPPRRPREGPPTLSTRGAPSSAGGISRQPCIALKVLAFVLDLSLIATCTRHNRTTSLPVLHPFLSNIFWLVLYHSVLTSVPIELSVLPYRSIASGTNALVSNWQCWLWQYGFYIFILRQFSSRNLRPIRHVVRHYLYFFSIFPITAYS